jgi:hypothetical protein
MVKETSNTAILGGCLGLLAFVLPWVAFVFILGGSSLLSILTSAHPQVVSIQLSNSKNVVTTQTPAIVAILEFIAALVILVFGILRARLGRPAVIVTFAGSALGIVALLITVIQTLSFTFTYNSGIDQFGGILYLGLGFWFAAVAFILVLVNSIRTLREG